MRRIMMPTDGSPMSEQAIPIAATIARVQHAEVQAVYVVAPPPWSGLEMQEYGMPSDAYAQLSRFLDRRGKDRLDLITERIRETGIEASGVLLHGSPAEALLSHEERTRPDLVVMSTHGHTGVLRFALGSVADRLAREGNTPCLLVRSARDPQLALETALVPLDGSETSEVVLSIVADLATRPLRRVHLLRVVQRAAAAQAAASYLEGMRSRFQEMGLEVETLTEIGDPALTIERHASCVDLAIMSTHGRGGVGRMRLGSVSAELVHHLTTPVLLVHARAPAGTASSVRGPVAVAV